jgi:hypothetical protein
MVAAPCVQIMCWGEGVSTMKVSLREHLLPEFVILSITTAVEEERFNTSSMRRTDLRLCLFYCCYLGMWRLILVQVKLLAQGRGSAHAEVFEIMPTIDGPHLFLFFQG